eukprot:1101690-Pleurochrysis_carterae.AAC.1
MYQARSLSELKGATLAIGQHHDDSKGLPLMLHRKVAAEGKERAGVSCLAEEIAQLYVSNALPYQGGVLRCSVRC